MYMKASNNHNIKIYIILTYTGTILSKIIRCYTGAEFCHASICLDEQLTEIYSFGRLNPYNPFIGGFVQEGLNIGTFKRFKNTRAEIYSVDLTTKQYKKMVNIIKKMKRKRNLYKFNTIGLFASAFNIKFQRKNRFYCSEFVKYLIEQSKIELNLPNLIKPNDFKNVNGLTLKYRGVLKDYSC